MVKSKQCFHIESIHCLRINTLYILRYELPKISNSFNNLMRDVLPEVSLQIFPVNFPSAHSEAALQRSPWTAAYSLGENAAAAHRSQGVISPAGKPPPRPKTCQPKRVWRLNSCIIASKWRRNICWGPGPRFKGFHGVWKKLINRELFLSCQPGF